MENIKAGSVIILSFQFLRSFGGFPTQKALASGAEPQTPMGRFQRFLDDTSLGNTY